MSERTDTTQWDWQWTATFVVVGSFGVSAILWGRGSQGLASVITIAAVVLGMYIIASGRWE